MFVARLSIFAPVGGSMRRCVLFAFVTLLTARVAFGQGQLGPRGDITSVTAGTGLTGGGTSGPVTLSADFSATQARVTGSCVAGMSIRAIAADGTVTCETDDFGFTVAGAGLLDGGNTVSIDPTYTQRRVSGTCSAGSAIRTVSQDGSVTCQSTTTFTTANTLPKGDGTGMVDSLVTDDGFTVGVAGDVSITGNIETGDATIQGDLSTNGDVAMCTAGVHVCTLGEILGTTASWSDNVYIGSDPSNAHELVGTVNFNATAGTNGQILQIVGGMPVWGAPSSAGINTFSTANAIPRGDGTGMIASGLTDDGTTIAASRRVVISNTSTTGALGVTQTSSASTTNNLGAIAVTHSGTVDTTASSMNAFGIIAQVTATRSAGANDLNNIAIYANATGAQNNEAIRADNGNVVLNKTSGNTCIGSSGCTTKLSVRGAGGSSGLTPIGNTIAMLENSGAPAYLSLLNSSSDMGVIFSNSTATNDGYILYTTAREMVLRSKGVNSMTLGGSSITINGATSVLGNTTLTRDDGGSHANRPMLAITNTASTGSLAHRAELQLNAYDASNVSQSSFIRAEGGTITIDAATSVSIKDGTTVDGAFMAAGGGALGNDAADSNSITGTLTANSTTGTNGDVLTMVSGLPKWQSLATSGIVTGTLTSGRSVRATGTGTVAAGAFTDDGTNATIGGALTVTGTLTASNSLIGNGSGAVTGYFTMGTAYGETNGFACNRTTNADATCHFNKVSYNNLSSVTRNLQINDGLGSALGIHSIAYFNGTDHSTTLYGVLDVNNDLVKLGSTIDGGVYFTGGPTGANSINFEYGTAAVATGYINRVANAGATGTFRNLVIADGKTNAIATFTGQTRTTVLSSGTTTAPAALTGSVLTLEQADATDLNLTLRGTGNKYIAFAHNGATGRDGYVWYSTSRNMLFGVAGQTYMVIDASSGIKMGDVGGVVINNNSDVLTIGNTGTGQTASTSLINSTHTGSFNTTAGSLTYYGLNIAVSATESAGTNTLTGVAARFSATNGDDPIGLWVDDGRAQLDGALTTEGSVTINDSGTSALYVPDGGVVFDGSVVGPGDPTLRVDGSTSGVALSVTGGDAVLGAALKTTNIVTPASVSGTLNDWTPTGLANAVMIRLRTTGDVTINGISSGASPQGRHLWIEYTGTNQVTFTAKSASNTFSTSRLNLKGDLLDRVWSKGATSGLFECTLHFIHDGTEWVEVDGDTDQDVVTTCRGGAI